MSTRAFIARKTGPADNEYGCTFEGRYHHSDGYPSGLGKFLADALIDQFHGDVEALLRRLIDSSAARCGWSTIVGRDLFLQPVSPEQSLDYYRAWRDNPCPQTEHAYHKTPVCYAARGTEDEDLLTQTCDLGWLEWGYLFDAEALEVWQLSYSRPPVRVVRIPYDLLPYVRWEALEEVDED